MAYRIHNTEPLHLGNAGKLHPPPPTHLAQLHLDRSSMLERRKTSSSLHHRNLAIIRNHQENPTIKHANNNLPIRRIRRFLDPLATISLHPSREIQASLPSRVRILWSWNDVHDDLIFVNCEGRWSSVF